MNRIFVTLRRSTIILRKALHQTNVHFKKRKTSEEKKLPRAIYYPPKSTKNAVDVWRNITVGELATSLGSSTDDLFEAMSFVVGASRYKSDQSVIDDPNIVKEIVSKFGKKSRIVAAPDSDSAVEKNCKDAVPAPPSPEHLLQPRPPVIAVMGHVDHGKTSLLDAIRNTRVVDTEFGGITQHIGAFTVKALNGEKFTFLDTPGHAAFATMRERGANVTDMVVLVVAADDGVMEQTIQSILMANNAKVPIIAAVNKIDKPSADVKRTLSMLAVEGVQTEELGGDVQAVPVSALTGQGLPQLLDAIAAQAELMALRADYGGLVEGVVLESRTDPGRGKLSTTLVKRGTLRKGSILVAGTAFAKVRAMFDDQGATVEIAPPATPVQVVGWRELPGVGETVLQVESERRANEVVRWRQQQLAGKKIESDQEYIKKKEEEHTIQYRAQLESKRKLGRYKIKPTGPRKKEIDWDTKDPYVNIIIKGDVGGSVEAILDVIDTYDCSHECKLDVVHYGVGPVVENDVELAAALNAVIYAFNVPLSPSIAQVARSQNISIKGENVIYKLIDDLKQVISSRLIPKQVEQIIGEAKIQQVFLVTEGKNKVPVAGSRCIKGELKKDALYKITRDGETVYEGKLVSMRHLKNEVGTVKKDVECGLMLEDAVDGQTQPGDLVICYKMVAQQQTTSWDPGF